MTGQHGRCPASSGASKKCCGYVRGEAMRDRETIVAEIDILVAKTHWVSSEDADYYILGRHVAANWDYLSTALLSPTARDAAARTDDAALLQMTLAHNVRKVALEEAAQVFDRKAALHARDA